VQGRRFQFGLARLCHCAKVSASDAVSAGLAGVAEPFVTGDAQGAEDDGGEGRVSRHARIIAA